VRTLVLEPDGPDSERRNVQAASGLALRGDTLYLVGDDRLHMAVFPGLGREPGTTVRVLPGHLPDDPKERKEQKPDLESLTPLDAFGPFLSGGLIALGSGSKSPQHRGVFVPYADGDALADPIVLEMTPLVDALNERFHKVNLEGTAVAGGRLRLFQRGNKKGSVNAHADLDLAKLCEAVTTTRVLTGDLICDVVEHDLGQIRGTKLCFSDADTLADGRVVFVASAEDDETSQDGRPIGSALGLMSEEGEVRELDPVDAETKIEGLAVRSAGGGVDAFVVADDDDPHEPTRLMRMTVPW